MVVVLLLDLPFDHLWLIHSVAELWSQSRSVALFFTFITFLTFHLGKARQLQGAVHCYCYLARAPHRPKEREERKVGALPATLGNVAMAVNVIENKLHAANSVERLHYSTVHVAIKLWQAPPLPHRAYEHDKRPVPSLHYTMQHSTAA